MKTILLVSLIIFSVIASAQVETAKQSLLELEQNIYTKSFSKKWKKKMQSEWEQKCKEAKNMDEINNLFNQYSDLLAQSASFSMGNSDAKTEFEFITYLQKVNKTLSKDLTSKWSVSDRVKWEDKMKVFVEQESKKIAAKKQQEEDAKQMKRLQTISKIVSDFEVKFKLVWEDSKKNEFKNILRGDVKMAMGNSKIDFKGGDQESIFEDKDGVRSFRVFFDAGGDVQMAEKIKAELLVIIEENLEKGYKRSNMTDGSFTKSNKFLYEYSGANFTETAKRPSVIIGVKEKTAGVYLQIMEPIFGN